MSDDIQVSVSTSEEAAKLREDFEEVIARVNGDLFGQSMDRNDPLSTERAVLQAEQSIDYHLRAFEDNVSLQQLGPQIKARFAMSIREQARAAQQKPR